MSSVIATTQQLAVIGTSFNFPASGSRLGVSNKQMTQTTPGGGSPGEILAIATGQGKLVDVSLIAASIGGWAIFINEDPTITILWGPDDGAGNRVPNGAMVAGDCAGPFRTDPAQTKWWFKSASGTPRVSVFFFPA